MDDTLPRFEAFPSYVSCIKNYGRPILPPLLSSAQRQEMAEIRHQAIIAEARIARRSIQKSSLMDKAKEIMEKIEKSQINLLEKHTDHDKGSGDHSLASSDHQAPINPSPYTDLPSPEQGDSMTNVPQGVQEKNKENTSVSNCSFSVHNAECCLSETEDSCSQSSVCEDTSSQFAFSIAESNSYIVKQSSCDQNPILSVGADFINSQQHQHKNLETSQLSGLYFSFDNSKGFEPNLSLEGEEWEENGDSSSAHKTSDIDETENASLATVILRSCDELPNDTDSDSMITSAAQSTDLEKYFDSPGDCQFSEGSEQTERHMHNNCCIQSSSSGNESNATLVNYDAEVTPIPCQEVLGPSGNDSRCESGGSCVSGSIRSSVFQEGTQRSDFRTHVRRSSYTLDKPSPALLQAFSSSPCPVNVLGTETSPYDDSHSEKLVPQITISPVSPFPPFELSGLIGELGDPSYIKNSHPCLSADQWAYRVTRDFCDNYEPSVRKGTCDIPENLCDPVIFANNDLYGKEPFSSNAFTVLSTPPKSLSPSKIRTLESALEESRNELCKGGTEEIGVDFAHSLIPGKPNVMDEKFLTQIFENLQEIQKKEVEKLKEEQCQQWEKLHSKFQEQETLLHEQLRSLYVSIPDSADKGVCHLEVAEPLVLNGSTTENFTRDNSVEDSNSGVPQVTSTSCEHSPQVENGNGGNGECDGITDPVLKRKFDRVSATVKGYLTRRLMKTERVQGIIQTIKDTLLCAVRFHEETPVKKGLITEQDADLHQRLISQITAACCELHDIFFKINTQERMLIISQSREFTRERRNKSDNEETNQSQKNSTFRHSPRSKTRPILSSATIKYLERKNLRSSSEGKNIGLPPKGKAASRAIPKRPSSASGRRTLLSPPTSLKSSKCTPYAKSNVPTKSSAKNPKSVRRLIYSRIES